MRSAFAILIAVCALATGSCSEVKDAPTQVTLRVQVDDAMLLKNMTHLRVTVLREDEDAWVRTGRATLSTTRARWPLDIPILPSSGASIAKSFEVIVDALDGDDRLAQTRALSGYRRDALTVLEVQLYRCAGHEPGFVCAPDDCHGTDCGSCTTSGECEPVPVRDPGELPAFSATETPATEPPTTLSDACSIDNGHCSEHATCTNTPAGALCSCKAGFEDSEGDGTMCIDKCTVAGCDTHATCTLMGDDAICSCAPPYTGNGRSCAFDEACSQLGCDPHATCATTSSARRKCACQAGYTGDGVTCTNVDECKQTPSPCGPNSTCTDADGSYACSCATGYRDTGSGCEIVDGDDCSPNPCLNDGSCRDLVNAFTCKCQAGFDGERCERNSNDCTASSCTNGTCVDGVNTFTCSCASGYTASADHKSCVQVDDCAGVSCGPGGTCIDGLNTYSCRCSSGYSGTGTKSCVNIDECAAGNACSPGGTCVDRINGYLCMCDYPVPGGIPPSSCRFTTRGDGTFDAQTGLNWSDIASEFPKDFSLASNMGHCQQNEGGRRVPTAAEMQTILATGYFEWNGSDLCWTTTTVDVCSPGKSTAGATLHHLRCVR